MLIDRTGAPLNKDIIPEIDVWARQALGIIRGDSRVREFIEKNPSAEHLLCAMFAMGSEITKTCAKASLFACAKTWPPAQELTGDQLKVLFKQIEDEIDQIGKKEVEVKSV